MNPYLALLIIIVTLLCLKALWSLYDIWSHGELPELKQRFWGFVAELNGRMGK